MQVHLYIQFLIPMFLLLHVIARTPIIISLFVSVLNKIVKFEEKYVRVQQVFNKENIRFFSMPHGIVSTKQIFI